MSRDVFGNVDNYCIGCGSPNGSPCADCGYGIRTRSAVTTEVESKPLTEVEKRAMRREDDEEDRRGVERAEMREHYL